MLIMEGLIMMKLFKVIAVSLFIIILIEAKVQGSQPNLKESYNIRNCINIFFDRYYKAYENLDNSSAVNMVRNNDNLYIFQRGHDAEIKFLKEIGLGYEEIFFEVEYESIKAYKYRAEVEVLVDMNFKYKKSQRIDSGVHNVKYKFLLIKDNGIWSIQEVQSDYEKYKTFIDDINERQLNAYQGGFRNGMTKRDAADEVFNEHLRIIYKTKEERPIGIKRKGIPQEYEHSAALYEKKPMTENIYSLTKGVEYALKYAEAPLSERLFYTAKSDCTNFISQCVWAGMGGYVRGNTDQVKENIRNRYKMTPQWFGNSGGGTPPWESVDRFFSYMKSKKCIVRNENSLAINVDPASIRTGDVLQFRRGESGAYTHSAYVTENLGNGEFSGIYVCQHSTDWKNRNLEDLILSPGWGGIEKCYMRHISFNERSIQ